MAIELEWNCAAHGEFTRPAGRGGKTPKCPKGCSPSFVVQEIRTAPALRSGSTGRVDAHARALAGDFGLSDIPSAREGESVMGLLRAKPTHQPTWGEVQHAEPGFSHDPKAARPTFSTGYQGFQSPATGEKYSPGVPVDAMKPAFVPLESQTKIIRDPRPLPDV